MPNELTIGNAVINFNANTSGLISGFRQIRSGAAGLSGGLGLLRGRFRGLRSETEQTTRNFARLARHVSSIRTTFLLGLGSTGLGIFVSQTSDAVVSLFELSVRTGETVANLQNLQRVFEGDGIAVEKFDKFIIQLTRSLGAARSGLASYADAFEDLGININNVESARDLILQLSDAVTSGRVGRDTALYALQVLGGRTGPQALNVLLQGRAGIEQAEEAFARLGNLTQEQAADIKVLAQAQTDLGSALQIGFQRLVGQNARNFTQFVKQLTSLLPVLFNTLSFTLDFLRRNIFLVRFAFLALVSFIVVKAVIRLSVSIFFVVKALEAVGFASNLNLKMLVAQTRASTREFARNNLTLTAMSANIRRIHTNSLQANAAFLGSIGPASWLRRTARTNRGVRMLLVSVNTLGAGIRTAGTVFIRTVGAFANPLRLASRILRGLAIPFLLFEGLYRSIRLFFRLRHQVEQTGESMLSLFRTTSIVLVAELIRATLTFTKSIDVILFTTAQYIADLIQVVQDNLFDLLQAAYDRYIKPFITVADTDFEGLWDDVQDYARDAFEALGDYANQYNEYLNQRWGIDFLAIGREAFEQFEKLAFEAWDSFRTVAIQYIGEIAEEFKGFLSRVAEASASLGEGLRERLGIKLVDPNDFNEATEGLNNIIEDANRQLQQTPLTVPIDVPEEPIKEDDIITAAARKTLTDIANVDFRLRENLQESSDTIRGYTDAAARFTDSLGRTDKSLEAYTKRLRAARIALGFESAVDETQSNLEKLSNIADIEFSKISDSAEGAAEIVEERLSQSVTSIGNAFGNFAGKVITDFRNIGDAVRDLARQIVDALVRRFVVNPISNFVGNLVGGLFPGLQDGGLGRGLTLVGEAGPEIVDFRQPGRVYSNEQLRDAIVGRAAGVGGNEPVVVNITVNSADSGAVTRAINDSLPAIIETVKGVVGIEAARPSALNAQLQRAF